jgi:DeoR/GlpR family transcriptional regulator of sugar metabolism
MGNTPIDFRLGITTVTRSDMETGGAKIDFSLGLILVVDSSKSSSVHTAFVAHVLDSDYLVIDSSISRGDIERLRQV